MRYYDGSIKWERIEGNLRASGFQMAFACTYSDCCPFQYSGRDSGWEMRRKIKQWCRENGITDYRIIRNTSYHKDLHGPAVYELWTRNA